MPESSPPQSLPDRSRSKRWLGIVLLLVVNVLWVLTSELTRFIFVDEGFKRPFFTWYVKSCMLTVYVVRYLACEPAGQQQHVYKILENDVSDCESMIDIGHHSLSLEGFENDDVGFGD
ncbi:hypothetical protein KIN20_002359 [Parelaphostrongylus tenuis]|uniref:Uncharacterized protein n=1 Tax=Parelaphostrongylus tenuis TaxID=148309 RepID=A0AAD5MNG6_PARTN|nr:hypothetical protein KIN20_002359 [Parelaphostrongylus tenuis]